MGFSDTLVSIGVFALIGYVVFILSRPKHIRDAEAEEKRVRREEEDQIRRQAELEEEGRLNARENNIQERSMASFGLGSSIILGNRRRKF